MYFKIETIQSKTVLENARIDELETIFEEDESAEFILLGLEDEDGNLANMGRIKITLGEAQELDCMDDDDKTIYCLWCDNQGSFSGLPSLREVQDYFRGKASNREEWAEDYIRECYTVPDFLSNHIDWTSVANELALDVDFCEDSSGNVYVFGQ